MESVEAMTGGILYVFFEPHIFPDPGAEEERIVRRGKRMESFGLLGRGVAIFEESDLMTLNSDERRDLEKD